MKDKFGYELTGGLFWDIFRDKNIREDFSLKKLNFGCGKDVRQGWNNVDLNSFDFNIYPYPLRDNHYDYILCKMVLEHVINVKKVLKELWRISRQNATIEIIVPFYNSFNAYSDVEHIHFFTDNAFSKNLNMDEYFEVRNVKLISSKAGVFFPFRKFLSRFIPGLIKQVYVELGVKKNEKKI